MTITHLIPCAECGAMFVPNTKRNQRFCSKRCGTAGPSRRYHQDRYRTDQDYAAKKRQQSREQYQAIRSDPEAWERELAASRERKRRWRARQQPGGAPTRTPSDVTPWNLLLELLDQPQLDWHDQAACRDPQVDPAWFFPERGASTSEAKDTCDRCPVQQECLDHQLEAGGTNTDVGIWGGTSARERRQIRRQRGAA